MTDQPLASSSWEVADAFEANELYQRDGLTDGLPGRAADGGAGAPLSRGGGARAGGRRRRRAGAPPPHHRREGRDRRRDGGRPPRVHAGRARARARGVPRPSSGCTAARRAPAAARRSSSSTGPIRRRIGMHATHNALANGSRANATIGRSAPARRPERAGRGARPARPLDARPSGQVHVLRRRGRGGQPVAAAVRRARRARGRVGGDRARRGVAAPDHERVDERPAGDPRDVRRGHPRQHADLLDLGGQLRARHGAASSARSSRPRAGRSRTCATACSSARASRGASGARSARRRSPAAGTRTRSTPRCARPTICWSSPPAGPAGGFGVVVPPWYGRKSLAVTEVVQDGPAE